MKRIGTVMSDEALRKIYAHISLYVTIFFALQYTIIL